MPLRMSKIWLHPCLLITWPLFWRILRILFMMMSFDSLWHWMSIQGWKRVYYHLSYVHLSLSLKVGGFTFTLRVYFIEFSWYSSSKYWNASNTKSPNVSTALSRKNEFLVVAIDRKFADTVSHILVNEKFKGLFLKGGLNESEGGYRSILKMLTLRVSNSF